MKHQDRQPEHGDDPVQRDRLRQAQEKGTQRAWLDFLSILGGSTSLVGKLIRKPDEGEDR